MSDNRFVILGQEVAMGERVVVKMDIAKLHTRNTISTPIIVERAEKPGPVLLLMAGIHGDEINGVAILREILRKKYNIPDRGTVICIPVFNVFGYLHLSREFPDGRDLNRVFPGAAKGSMASQFAHKFTHEIIPLVDYVLDFHTGGAYRDNYPNVRCVLKQEQNLALAHAFGAPFILNSRYIAKSVRDTINKMGKSVLLFEGGKSVNLDSFVIRHGVEGALNVMNYLGMRDQEPASVPKSIVIERSKWLRAPFSGIFQTLIQNGSWVTKKSIIGIVFDPYGEFEENIIAPFDCYIFSVNTAPIVHKGDAIFHVSTKVQDD
ncbi:succinylglutamate desuccinylase/aspartoacylase family protein [Persicitalea sp.]|uniref:succinylglutamate desuccinylase/aspartoacylase family protein n=1 Tax=Persicitalea sp. TaxID=3100273 RepID=UPI0035941F21